MRKISKQAAAHEILVGLGTTDITLARQEAARRGLSISDSTFYKAIKLAGFRENTVSLEQLAKKSLEGALAAFDDSLKSVPKPLSPLPPPPTTPFQPTVDFINSEGTGYSHFDSERFEVIFENFEVVIWSYDPDQKRVKMGRESAARLRDLLGNWLEKTSGGSTGQKTD